MPKLKRKLCINCGHKSSEHTSTGTCHGIKDPDVFPCTCSLKGIEMIKSLPKTHLLLGGRSPASMSKGITLTGLQLYNKKPGLKQGQLTVRITDLRDVKGWEKWPHNRDHLIELKINGGEAIRIDRKTSYQLLDILLDFIRNQG